MFPCAGLTPIDAPEVQTKLPLYHKMKRRTSRTHVSTWFMLGMAAGLVYSFSRRRSNYSFKDRVVVITGGSRGLGLVLARKLAGLGTRVALLARSPEELETAEQDLRRRGAEVLGLPCDIRHRQQVETAVDEVVKRFGRVDVLINNAGVIQVGPL